MSKSYESKFSGLSIAYNVFHVLSYINPALVMIYAIIKADEFGAIMFFGGPFVAFLAWLFTALYRDIILLFVKMGKDINEIKNKK